MDFQKYPIGRQDFKSIRNENLVYIDKTKYVYSIASQGGYFFLSRPRRFGKSLLVSTFEYLLKGEQVLFKGLFIEQKWDFIVYPVIKISFADIGYRESNLEIAIHNKLYEIAESYDLVLSSTGISQRFKELIQTLNQKYKKKVVILIDEYDKPITDYLEQEKLHIAKENQDTLKSFYSILKDADSLLKLVFITGVSKFSQVSIFSDLNNLYDITFTPIYNEVCGISQTELEFYFSQELEISDNKKIKEWYNGYRWDSEGNTIYNPFSILRFFGDGGKKYNNFWFQTGTPTFLMVKSRELGLYEMENVESTLSSLSSFDIENIQIIPLLFQTGYLTINSYDETMHLYHLDFPNLEVKHSYLEGLLNIFTYDNEPQSLSKTNDLLKALKLQDKTLLQNSINVIFEHIPYPLWTDKSENFFHAIIHLIFSLLGVFINSEVCTKNGRADAIIILEEGIYCLEFKLDKSATQAVNQVKERGYLNSYIGKSKPCHIIGINFDGKHKIVEEIIWEKI